MRHEKSERSTPWGNGLVLFRPGTPSNVRRRRLTVLAIGLLCAAAVMWPVYPLVGSASPRVLGLPFSLAWLILSLTVMFGALVWLFRHDDRDAPGVAPEEG